MRRRHRPRGRRPGVRGGRSLQRPARVGGRQLGARTDDRSPPTRPPFSGGALIHEFGHAFGLCRCRLFGYDHAEIEHRFMSYDTTMEHRRPDALARAPLPRRLLHARAEQARFSRISSCVPRDQTRSGQQAAHQTRLQARLDDVGSRRQGERAEMPRLPLPVRRGLFASAAGTDERRTGESRLGCGSSRGPRSRRNRLSTGSPV